MSAMPLPRLTPEQYLEIERAAEFRSEYFDGEMFAMSGGTMNHSLLQANLISEVRPRARERGCRTLTSDFRVRVSATGMCTYPDVIVVCEKPRLADEHADTLLNPTVIFEVLSPSSEKYDRGVKFQNYRTIESLKDYILVDQNQVLIEQYTRQGANTWKLRDYQSLEDELTIDSIGVTIPLRGIYDQFEPPSE